MDHVFPTVEALAFTYTPQLQDKLNQRGYQMRFQKEQQMRFEKEHIGVASIYLNEKVKVQIFMHCSRKCSE